MRHICLKLKPREKEHNALRMSWYGRVYILVVITAIMLLGASLTTPASAQNTKITVTGTVTDANNQPMPGVAVVAVTESSVQTATDLNGKFSISVESGMELAFYLIGYETQFVTVTGTNRELAIQLKELATDLEGVIVTGYQTIKPTDRKTGSCVVVPTTVIQQRLNQNIMQRIEGVVPGLMVSNNLPVIRGRATLGNADNPVTNNAVLLVVDGFPYNGRLSDIPNSEIENITVLKDAAASSIYGSQSANGVIVVSTRRGKEGSMGVSYTNSFELIPVPNRKYLDLASCREQVDLNVAMFRRNPDMYQPNSYRNLYGEVFGIMHRLSSNPAQMNAELDKLRNLNNEQQLRELLRPSLNQQHNLAIYGGSKTNTYRTTLGFERNTQHNIDQGANKILFGLNDEFAPTKWFKMSIGANMVVNQSEGYNGFDAYKIYSMRRPDNYLDVETPIYRMLKDADGNALPWPLVKSPYQLQWQNSIGLLDETYYPIKERKQQRYNNNDLYYRVNGGMRFTIIEGLSADLKFQTEIGRTKLKSIMEKTSSKNLNFIYDFVQYNPLQNPAITMNLPYGGILDEEESEMSAYTMRAQLNLDRKFGTDHKLVALMGAERKAVKTFARNERYFGYNENGLLYKPIDADRLKELDGTIAQFGSASYTSQAYNRFSQNEDRFVSFYGNANYTYLNKYVATGSIRVDQSNLFGTNIQNQFKPFWSLGAAWYIGDEEFMQNVAWINMLQLRYTYGINGNSPIGGGPYLYGTFYNAASSVANMDYVDINNYPDPNQRWERSSTHNFGADFALINCLHGSLDFYYKNTTDLIADISIDPTLGLNSRKLNYGSMVNKGVEVMLNSTNIARDNFMWGTTATLSYNHNRITKLDVDKVEIYDFFYENSLTKGKPANSIYSLNWAGLNPMNGTPQIYDQDGNIIGSTQNTEDLVYSGTIDPIYTAAIDNEFIFFDFTLSFQFVYYGGHVFRDQSAKYLDASEVNETPMRSTLNYWKLPNDGKNDKYMAPAIQADRGNMEQVQSWEYASVHVKPADFIKLRNITLMYNIPDGVVQKLRLKNLNVSVQASNVWRWVANDSGTDPETTHFRRRTLEMPLTFLFGLSTNF